MKSAAEALFQPTPVPAVCPGGKVHRTLCDKGGGRRRKKGATYQDYVRCPEL